MGRVWDTFRLEGLPLTFLFVFPKALPQSTDKQLADPTRDLILFSWGTSSPLRSLFLSDGLTRISSHTRQQRLVASVSGGSRDALLITSRLIYPVMQAVRMVMEARAAVLCVIDHVASDQGADRTSSSSSSDWSIAKPRDFRAGDWTESSCHRIIHRKDTDCMYSAQTMSVCTSCSGTRASAGRWASRMFIHLFIQIMLLNVIVSSCGTVPLITMHPSIVIRLSCKYTSIVFHQPITWHFERGTSICTFVTSLWFVWKNGRPFCV